MTLTTDRQYIIQSIECFCTCQQPFRWLVICFSVT